MPIEFRNTIIETAKKKSLEYTKEAWSSKELRTYEIEFNYKYEGKGNWKQNIKKAYGIELYKWIRQMDFYI